MAGNSRDYEIVVFGASGFTGQFVAREVAKNSKGKFQWAVAGRKREKLEQVLRETEEEVGELDFDRRFLIVRGKKEKKRRRINDLKRRVGLLTGKHMFCAGYYRVIGNLVHYFSMFPRKEVSPLNDHFFWCTSM